MVAQSFAVRGIMQSVLAPRSVARLAISQTRCYQIPQMPTQTYHASPLFIWPSSRVPVARMSTGVRASLVDKVKEMAQKHKVVVFAKSYCPYCMQVRELFNDLQVDAQVFNLDELGEEDYEHYCVDGTLRRLLHACAADGDEVQDALMDITGSRTVPQVFVGSHYIGGCDDTMAKYKSSQLKKLFQEAGVSANL